MFTPLTVMHAYVQLLRRRMGSGAPCETQDLEQALADMEKATRTMTADLRAILSATTHP